MDPRHDLPGPIVLPCRWIAVIGGRVLSCCNQNVRRRHKHSREARHSGASCTDTSAASESHKIPRCLHPNSKHRALLTPVRRGKGNKSKALPETQGRSHAERRASMTWAQRLKRVFNIEIETCQRCGGAVRVIACIEDPALIEEILTHQ
jgi:hypothetical protein